MVVMPLLFMRAGLKKPVSYTIEPVLDIEKLESHEDGFWEVVMVVVIAVSPLCYIATNFLGHGTVNPKANESDD